MFLAKSGAINVAPLPQLPGLSGLATRALLRLHAEYRVQDSLGRVDLQREYAKLVSNVREGGREEGGDAKRIKCCCKFNVT